MSNACRLTLMEFGLFPFRSPLLRESRLLSIPAGTEMFQFPAFTSIHLCIQWTTTGYYPNRLTAASRVASFRDPRIKACYAAPRGLSQLRHVFRRLSAPRHPSHALISLTMKTVLFSMACSLDRRRDGRFIESGFPLVYRRGNPP